MDGSRAPALAKIDTAFCSSASSLPAKRTKMCRLGITWAPPRPGQDAPVFDDQLNVMLIVSAVVFDEQQ